MSSRALRKLHGNDDLFPELQAEESSEDEVENTTPPLELKTDAGNLFDLVSEKIFYLPFRGC